jgi:hypothetical protein
MPHECGHDPAPDRDVIVSTYVRVEELGCLRQLAWQPTFLGEINLIPPGPIGQLVLIEWPSRRFVGKLDEYPNRTELGLCLFARLFRQPAPVEPCPARMVLRVTIGYGSHAPSSIVREVLQIELHGRSMRVHLLSPLALIADLRVKAPRDRTIRGLVGSALAAALKWRSLPPAFPRPLTEVPVHRRDDGSKFIFLSEVPALSRHYLRSSLQIDSRATEVDYPQWTVFISTI